MSAQSHQRRPKTNDSKRLPPAASRRLTPHCTNSMPAPMPATCDGGDNDACDQHNEDNSRDIFHDALCAGNIGTQGKTTPPATHSAESHTPMTPDRPSAIKMITRSSSVIVAPLSNSTMLTEIRSCVL
jgi:hypothetical protein